MDSHIETTFNGSRLSHAYIVPLSLAHTLAMAVVCSSSEQVPCLSCSNCNKSSRNIHPDITVIGKLEGKREIQVNQIRELKKDVIVVPNDSNKKAYIIREAETMNVASQNAILRILEEPPSHTVFILATESPDGLLPTVRSRCITINQRAQAPSVSASIDEISDEFIEAIKADILTLTKFMFRLEKLDRLQFSSFLVAACDRLSQELRSITKDQGTPFDGYNSAYINMAELLSHTEKTLLLASELLGVNVNVGHIAGMICANLIQIREMQKQ